MGWCFHDIPLMVDLGLEAFVETTHGWNIGCHKNVIELYKYRPLPV